MLNNEGTPIHKGVQILLLKFTPEIEAVFIKFCAIFRVTFHGSFSKYYVSILLKLRNVLFICSNAIIFREAVFINTKITSETSSVAKAFICHERFNNSREIQEMLKVLAALYQPAKFT